MQYLIDNGARIEAKTGGLTPLYLAVTKGNVEIVKLFLEKGANLEAKTEQ